MPSDEELMDMLRAVLKEELKPVNDRLTALEAGQQRIEAIVNDTRDTNRKTHKKLFAQLDEMWKDIKSNEHRVNRLEEKVGV